MDAVAEGDVAIGLTLEVETVRISDKLCIDLAPDGTVYASSFSTPTQNFVAPTAGDSCS